MPTNDLLQPGPNFRCVTVSPVLITRLGGVYAVHSKGHAATIHSAKPSAQQITAAVMLLNLQQWN